jgi:hypothetical protein
MTTENRIGRSAGLLYLVVVIAGVLSLAYVPSQITVADNPQSTANNIVSSAALFRFGIVAFIVMQVAFLLLPMTLFRLFRSVNHTAAVLMVALAVVSVPIALSSLTNQMDALSLLTDRHFNSAFTPGQVHAAAWASLQAYGRGLQLASLFWGLWLLPLGYLVFKSGLLPRLLGNSADAWLPWLCAQRIRRAHRSTFLRYTRRSIREAPSHDWRNGDLPLAPSGRNPSTRAQCGLTRVNLTARSS